MTAIAGHNGVLVIFNVVEQAEFLERFDDGFACFIAVHAAELAVTFNDMCGFVENVDAREVVALAHAPVIGIMSRGYLDEAGTELGIDHEVLEDGDLAIDEWKHDLCTDEFLLCRIFRGNGYAGVAEHRLGTGRSYDDVFDAVDRLDQRVA